MTSLVGCPRTTPARVWGATLSRRGDPWLYNGNIALLRAIVEQRALRLLRSLPEGPVSYPTSDPRRMERIIAAATRHRTWPVPHFDFGRVLDARSPMPWKDTGLEARALNVIIGEGNRCAVVDARSMAFAYRALRFTHMRIGATWEAPVRLYGTNSRLIGFVRPVRLEAYVVTRD